MSWLVANFSDHFFSFDLLVLNHEVFFCCCLFLVLVDVINLGFEFNICPRRALALTFLERSYLHVFWFSLAIRVTAIRLYKRYTSVDHFVRKFCNTSNNSRNQVRWFPITFDICFYILSLFSTVIFFDLWVHLNSSLFTIDIVGKLPLPTVRNLRETLEFEAAFSNDQLRKETY